MKNNKELSSRVASLESKVDYLESELMYINQLLVKSGFPEGIKTLTATVEEYLEEGFDSLLQEKKGYLEGI